MGASTLSNPIINSLTLVDYRIGQEKKDTERSIIYNSSSSAPFFCIIFQNLLAKGPFQRRCRQWGSSVNQVFLRIITFCIELKGRRFKQLKSYFSCYLSSFRTFC